MSWAARPLRALVQLAKLGTMAAVVEELELYEEQLRSSVQRAFGQLGLPVSGDFEQQSSV